MWTSWKFLNDKSKGVGKKWIFFFFYCGYLLDCLSQLSIVLNDNGARLMKTKDKG